MPRRLTSGDHVTAGAPSGAAETGIVVVEMDELFDIMRLPATRTREIPPDEHSESSVATSVVLVTVSVVPPAFTNDPPATLPSRARNCTARAPALATTLLPPPAKEIRVDEATLVVACQRMVPPRRSATAPRARQLSPSAVPTRLDSLPVSEDAPVVPVHVVNVPVMCVVDPRLPWLVSGGRKVTSPEILQV